MENTYALQLDKALTEMAQAVEQFTNSDLNVVPFEGSWSAAQVTVHVLKSVEGLPKLFSSEAVSTERDPHQFEAELKKIFLDFDTRMKSPEFILPGDGPFQKDELIERLNETRRAINEKVKDVELSNTFTSFSFPGTGPLTGYELLCFAYCHSTRHARQVTKIFEALTDQTTFKIQVS